MLLRLNTLLARLLVGSGIPVVLFVLVGVAGAVTVFRLNQSQYWEQQSLRVLVEAERQKVYLDQLYLAAQGSPLLGTRALRNSYEVNRAGFLQTCSRLEELVRQNPVQEKRALQVCALESDWHQALQREQRRQAARVKAGQDPEDDESRRVAARSDQSVKGIHDLQGQFMATEQELLQERHQEAAAQSTESIWFIGVMGALAVFLGPLVLYIAARSVTRPLMRLCQASSELLAGTFRLVPPTGPDEIAQLTSRFNHMGLTLSQRALQLQEQEARYRTYVGASAHILWMTNPLGEVIADIPSWRAYTGQTDEEVRGMGWLNAVHAEDQAAAREAWTKAVQEQAMFDVEYRMKNKCGEYRHFACRAVPVLDAAGVLREWIGTCTDVTAKKEEAALRQAKEAAEAANLAKSMFLAKMSHELRTPLNAVIGMSKMLATQRFGPLNAKQADYLADISQAGEHLLSLISDILDLTKVEAGRMELHPESFAVHEKITASASTLHALAENKNLALILKLADCDGEMTTDPARFKQVLYNLLSNAIKFTPAGSVTVACQWLDSAGPEGVSCSEGEARALRIDVADTGIGIAAADQPAIWEEFRQLDDRRAGFNEGTGLGLALTRRLVHLLGGRITLESQVGVGSTFTVILPRHRFAGAKTVPPES